MPRDVANGLEFGLVRIIWRRFATVRYLGGIFESYRWSNLVNHLYTLMFSL